MKIQTHLIITALLALCATNLFASGPYDDDYNPRIGATPAPGSGKPSYTVSYTVMITDGWISVGDADGETFGKIKCADWAKALNQPLPTTRDERRHFALDIIAAAVAGDGGREHITAPDLPVITVKESDGSVGTAARLTIEHGSGFAILVDTDQHGFYYAEIIMITPDELKRGRWFNPAPSSHGKVVPS
jgi:hypothetical protein